MIHILWWSYYISAPLLIIVSNVWISLMDTEWKPRSWFELCDEETEIRWTVSFAAILWPLVIVGVIAYFIGCGVWRCITFLIKDLPRSIKYARRKAIVDAELAEKHAADLARVGGERGAHR